MGPAVLGLVPSVSAAGADSLPAASPPCVCVSPAFVPLDMVAGAMTSAMGGLWGERWPHSPTGALAGTGERLSKLGWLLK